MKKEIEAIKSAIVDSTESEFHVNVKSDDYGVHYCIYLPRHTETKVLHSRLKTLTLSKRYIILFVHDGYIGSFLRNKN